MSQISYPYYYVQYNTELLSLWLCTQNVVPETQLALQLANCHSRSRSFYPWFIYWAAACMLRWLHRPGGRWSGIFVCTFSSPHCHYFTHPLTKQATSSDSNNSRRQQNIVVCNFDDVFWECFLVCASHTASRFVYPGARELCDRYVTSGHRLVCVSVKRPFCF